MNIVEVLINTIQSSGFAAITSRQAIMLLVSFVLLYMAIVKKFEPLLLLPISFGMMLANLPLACNTVTAQCIGFLRENFPFEIIGIQPAVKPASAVGGKCLVLATPSTAQSNSLHDLIGRFGSGETKVAPCSDLASYIEENVGNFNPAEVERLLPKESADSVVLGCTHYSFVKDIIKNYYNCPVFDGNEGTSAHLCEKLGISDHRAERAQSIAFIGGNTDKNRSVFRSLMVDSGVNSLKV